MKCEYCGKEFETVRKRGSERRFCSASCRSSAYKKRELQSVIDALKGKESELQSVKHSLENKERELQSVLDALKGRERELQIDVGPICVVCGSSKNIEMHHWAPRYLFGDESNIWPTSYLCKECHDIWHKKVTPKMSTK